MNSCLVHSSNSSSSNVLPIAALKSANIAILEQWQASIIAGILPNHSNYNGNLRGSSYNTTHRMV